MVGFIRRELDLIKTKGYFFCDKNKPNGRNKY